MTTPDRCITLIALALLLTGCRDNGAPQSGESREPEAADTPARSPSPPPSIRVVSWNLQWFPGRSPKANHADARIHAGNLLTALQELEPDVLLLQEVQPGHELDRLLAGLGDFMHVDFKIHASSTFPGRQQICIASHLPAESAWVHRWEKDGQDDPPRGYAYASLRLSDGRLLHTYTVHLKSNARAWTEKAALSNREKRQDAARQLLGHIDGLRSTNPDDPILIAGDLNTDPDADQFAGERTIPMLVEGGLRWLFEKVEREARITWPADGRYPDAHFDHAFARGLEIEGVSVPADYDHCSDHRPVVVDVVVEAR